MDFYRNYFYDNCCRQVYNLLIDNRIEKLEKQYPLIKDYVPLFQIINDIIKNSHAFYIDWNDYQTIINTCDELMPFYQKIVDEKDFLSLLYSWKWNLYSYFRIFFDTEWCEKVPSLVIYYLSYLFDMKIDDISIIKDNRIRMLFQKIDECRDKKNDCILIVLLLYGHIHGNYDVLNKYLQGYNSYRKKFSNKYKVGLKNFSLSSDEVNMMFKDMDSFIPSQQAVIK